MGLTHTLQLSESDIMESLETMCDPDTEAGDWLNFLDLQEDGDRLKVTTMSGVRNLGAESVQGGGRRTSCMSRVRVSAVRGHCADDPYQPPVPRLMPSRPSPQLACWDARGCADIFDVNSQHPTPSTPTPNPEPYLVKPVGKL